MAARRKSSNAAAQLALAHAARNEDPCSARGAASESAYASLAHAARFSLADTTRSTVARNSATAGGSPVSFASLKRAA